LVGQETTGLDYREITKGRLSGGVFLRRIGGVIGRAGALSPDERPKLPYLIARFKLFHLCADQPGLGHQAVESVL
jgi:hypothetical protein